MLKIKNITKTFGGIKAIDNCSFEIEPKKITALIGPNGAGKTTLFDVISGLLKADKGNIFLEGQEITNLWSSQIAEMGVSRSFQQVRLFKNLTILDHLVMVDSIDDHKVFKQVFSKQKINKERVKEYNELLKEFTLEKSLDTKVSDLSYGQRKLLQMALVFRMPHKILLLDEPVAGVNKVLQQKINELLLSFKKNKETIVLIEHDIEFVRKLADKIVVMDEGKVLTQGTPAKVLKDKRVLEAYLGE